MFKRPTPKKLSAEQFAEIAEASSRQTGRQQRIRSYDPDYPVFEIPVNEKLLIYIPNHTVTSADGTIDIRKDKFAAHSTQKGRSFSTIRCTSGIVAEELGLDGSCPFCEASAEIWDLYNKELAGVARAKGVSLDDPASKELLKEDVKNLLNKRAIRPAEIYYTFPIVVIDCEVDSNGKKTTTPKKDENGRISGKPMWYTIRESTYADKWVKAFETVQTDDDIPPTHPAGQWAVLNFTYESKSGKHDKMGSAKALAVGFKRMSDGYTPWAQHFDEMTSGWTPAKAMETLVDNAIRDMTEQTEACDEVMKPVRDRLAMIELGNTNGVSVGNASAEATLASFGGAVPVSPAVPLGVPDTTMTEGIPQVGIQ